MEISTAPWCRNKNHLDISVAYVGYSLIGTNRVYLGEERGLIPKLNKLGECWVKQSNTANVTASLQEGGRVSRAMQPLQSLNPLSTELLLGFHRMHFGKCGKLPNICQWDKGQAKAKPERPPTQSNAPGLLKDPNTSRRRGTRINL